MFPKTVSWSVYNILNRYIKPFFFSLNLTSDLHTNKILYRVLTALVISSLDIPTPSKSRSLLLHKTHRVFPNN